MTTQTNSFTPKRSPVVPVAAPVQEWLTQEEIDQRKLERFAAGAEKTDIPKSPKVRQMKTTVVLDEPLWLKLRDYTGTARPYQRSKAGRGFARSFFS